MISKELLQLLRDEDEVVLLELLELNSDAIVDAFLDVIEERAGRLLEHYEEEL